MAGETMDPCASLAQLLGATVLESQRAVCPTHGPYTAVRSVAPSGRVVASVCPLCNLAARYAASGPVAAERRREELAGEVRGYLTRAGVPVKYLDMGFSNYAPAGPAAEKAWRLARTYAEQFADMRRAGTSLRFLGAVGTGKTHLAVAILKTVARQGYGVRYTRAIDLLDAIKATYHRSAALTTEQALARYTQPDLLVLDEVGVGRHTAEDRLLFYRVLDGRYCARRPTLVVSNLDNVGLAQALDGRPGELEDGAPPAVTRCMDRLLEGGGRAVVFDWASARAAEAVHPLLVD